MASVLVFDPVTQKTVYGKPQNVELPISYAEIKRPLIINPPPKSTSPWLIALMFLFIVILIIVVVYFLWLLFIKKSNDNPASFFAWIAGQG
jgi:hypothetical protein